MRYGIKIETGTYTGTGSAQTISPVCAGPNLVMTQRANGTATVCYTLWSRMPENGANSFGGAHAEKANQLVALTKDGFYVGGGQSQSSALYVYLAIKASRSCTNFQTGRYVGTGANNRAVINTNKEGTPFQPNFIYVQRATDGYNGLFRTSEHTGDASSSLTSADTTNNIKTIEPTGFTVGTATGINASGAYYNWFALKNLSGAIKVGGFIGTGASQSITLGWQPTFVMVKNRSTTDPAIVYTSTMVSNSVSSLPVSAANSIPQGITSLDQYGFTVGTDASCNGSGNTLCYLALKDGEYAGDISRTSI